MTPARDEPVGRAGSSFQYNLPVHGGRISVETFGTASGSPPIIFVHGWALDRRVWTPQVDAFSTGRNVVTYDRRGFGTSTAPANLEREVDDLLALFDVIDARDVIVVGMSQGARIAVEATIRAKHRIAGLALLGAPSIPGLAADEGAYAPPIGSLRAARTPADRAQILREHPLFALPGGEGLVLRDEILANYRGSDLTTVPAKGFGSPARLPEDVPTMFLHGEQDAAARIASARTLAASRGAADFKLLVGAGHLANLCSPRMFNAVLHQFVSGLIREREPLRR
jgi:pimeloyl-ACP methyl ester carboxylesterase